MCYRHTVRTLCNNNQYNTALLFTEKMKKIGIIITPSSLAQLLSIFEINEDLSHVQNFEKVTLLEFQEDIFSTCLLGAKFEKYKLQSNNEQKRENSMTNIKNEKIIDENENANTNKTENLIENNNKSKKNRKIKIGFVSAHFRRHSIFKLFGGIITGKKKDQNKSKPTN